MQQRALSESSWSVDTLVRLSLCLGLAAFAMTAFGPDTRANTKMYMGVKIKPITMTTEKIKRHVA